MKCMPDYTAVQINLDTEEANEIFENVNNVSVAVLDSKTVNSTSQAGLIKTKALRMDSSAFESIDFLNKLVRFMGGRMDQHGLALLGQNGGLDWGRVGKVLCENSLRAPGMDLMYGPLNLEGIIIKPRVFRARHKPDPKERVIPIEIDKDHIESDPQATTNMVKAIYEKLRSIESSAVPYLRFIVNPDSFAQTVENIFYYSFLVRDGTAALELDDDKDSESYRDIIAFVCEAPTQADLESGGRKTQMILDMTMEVWEGAIKAYGIKESMIPTREITHTKVKASNQW